MLSNSKLRYWAVVFAVLFSGAHAGASVALKLDDPNVSQWMLLMQYRKSKTGYLSKIKAVQFFISPDGQFDPESELKASIDLFQKELPSGNSHPQCLFPARYQTLRKSFTLAAPVYCENLHDWKSTYKVSTVSLFYAGPYMSSPSSVFGHSFLLLGSTELEEYSQITFNYAADIPEGTGAFDYAYKGLTGGFPGVISILPYYQRLYQYTDMENRDLWEYRLNLNAAQVDLLADYIWEIRNQVQFDYYFFDENCASILLWILKAVSPRINIETSNSIYVSPPEITQVIDRENLVHSVVYHPALLKRLNSKINLMSASEKKKFRNMLDTDKVSDDEANPVLLEAMMDHLNIQRHRKNGHLPEILKPIERTVLLQRSKIQKAPITFDENETPLKPHTSHAPMRIQLGAFFKNDTISTSFSLRPGVHDLLDYTAGYLPNSSIKILEFEIHAVENKRLRLQNLTILNLTNLPSINFYENQFSWSVDIQIRQNDFYFKKDRLLEEAKVTAGYAIDLNPQNLFLYSHMSLAARSNEGHPLGNLELGPMAGFIYSLNKLKINFYSAYLWQDSGQQEPVFTKLSSEASYRLNQEWSFYAGYGQLQDLNQNFKSEQFKLALQHYF